MGKNIITLLGVTAALASQASAAVIAGIETAASTVLDNTTAATTTTNGMGPEGTSESGAAVA